MKLFQSKKEEGSERKLLEQLQADLRPRFKDMTHEVPLLLFTSPGKNDPLSDATRAFIRIIRQISPKVTLREYDLSHKEAQKWHVDHAPTIIFQPDQLKVRWLGAPMGEEARSFIEALVMLGKGDAGLSDDSMKVLSRIQSPREIKIFVSPSCPYCPQQAVNTLKAAIAKPELVSLEIIDIQANPELANQYSAQSVPMVFANETLIAQGAQPEELFMLSLEKMEQQTVFIPESDALQVEADLVIVGGGPAGLTAGIYGARSGLKTVLIEKGALGGQVATTPVVENYPGLTQVGGKVLVDLLVTHALEYVKIFPGEEVMDLQPGEPMVLVSNRRRFSARAVLLATGATYRHLDVPGEVRLSGHGVSYCSTCDGPLFKGKKVILVGGGNSAVTEALHLHHIGVDVTLVHRRDSLRAQELLTRNLTSNQVPILYNTEVREIRGKDRVEEVKLVNNRTGKAEMMPAEGVFVAIGYTPSVDLARKLKVDLTPEGYIKHDSRHRTNIPGIYSAGDVEGGYKQIVTAAGQGAEAALAIFEDLISPYWKTKEAKAG